MQPCIIEVLQQLHKEVEMKAQFSRNRTFSDTKGKTGSDKAPRVEELVEVLKLRSKKWTPLRLVGSVFSYGQHWLPIVTKEGKETNFPKVCLAYDDEIEEKDSEKACPYCDLIDYIQVHYYVNVIVRELEEDVPARIRQTPEEKKTGFKDMNSDSWTPVRVLRLPAGAVAKLNQLSELNLHGPKGKRVSYPLSDEQYGRDVMVMYDKDAAPANQYTFQLGEPTVLEEDYLLWNVENLMVPEELKVAKEQAKRLAALSPDSAEDGEGCSCVW
jgi:hypothetical protein